MDGNYRPSGALQLRAAPPRVFCSLRAAQRASERQCARGECLGHRPTERDQTVTTLAVDGAEQASEGFGLAGRLLRVVVEKTGSVPVAPEHERAVVELPVSAEPLGETATPGALL